jgi:glycerol-3-phosphate acyltransferase PlsY
VQILDININIWFYLSAYLLGSIPFGFVLAKIFAKVNIRELGSNNIGATNVMRVVKKKNAKLAKKLSGATFLLDFFKAIFILSIASYFQLEENVIWAIAFIVIFGHCFSIYLGFEGGKGVSTFFGIMIFFYPIFTVIGLLTWIGVLKVFKISSMSALVSTTLIVSLIYFLDTNLVSFVPIAMIYFLVIYKHFDNIIGLFTKQEGEIV